jgi:dCTP deaminase
MPFWSSQKIEENIDRITDYPNKEMVDCNALTLRIGPEIYVTPGLEHTAPSSHTKTILADGEPVTIPPGQFAFLLTEETVSIPRDVMGFISVKATYKLKGLVNVSGFHVDPGWSGRLLFTVFNAGPATIHLQRGLPVFLLWVADLTEASEKHKAGVGPDCIPPGVIGNITGVVDSIYALEKRVKADIKDVSDKQDSFKEQVAEIKEGQAKVLLYIGIAAVVGGGVVGAVTKLVADRIFPHPDPAGFSQNYSASSPPIPLSSGTGGRKEVILPRVGPSGAATGGTS